MRTIDIHVAKAQFTRLLDDVRVGEEIIRAKAGEPYARLVPIGAPPRRELGFLPGLVGSGDAAPESLDVGDVRW